jgi:amino acid transporter
MELFLSGAMMAAYCVATLFFVRFWRKAGDRLFLAFAMAFGLLALQRLGLTVSAANPGDDDTWLYVVRLMAFLIILWAIVDKNRSATRRR